MVVIWGVVVANWSVHMLFRAASWSQAVIFIGHFIVAMQISAYAQCINVHPGSPPPEWPIDVDSGAAGLPPRAYLLRRSGEVILGFDHYCWWIGAPIGFRNRKFFVLFLL